MRIDDVGQGIRLRAVPTPQAWPAHARRHDQVCAAAVPVSAMRSVAAALAMKLTRLRRTVIGGRPASAM
jgi:hypothetical protein